MKFVSKIPVLTLLFVGVLLLSPQCTRAQFTAGNIVVVRVGDGSATLTSAATPVFLDEYKTTGTYVQTITVNASTAGSRSTNSGTATSEGFVHRSVDGRYVAFGGYDAASGTASITSSNSSSINRVIARVDALGSIDYSTKINDSAAPGNIRSTTTSDGSAFWAGTSGGGVKYVAFGNTGASVQLSTAPANARVVNIFNDQLYVSSSTGTGGNYYGISTVGTGLPTTSGQTATPLNGFPTSSGPSSYDYAISSDGNTIYLADDRATASGGGVQKWTYGAGTWTLAYTLTSGLSYGCRALTVDWSGTNPVIYAVEAGSGTTASNKLWEVTDAGSSSSFTNLATSATNEAFRGVAFAPYSTITFTDGSSYVAPNGTANTNDNPIGRFQLASNLNGSKLKSLNVNLTGTYTGINALRLYALSSATFSVTGSTLLASTTAGGTATFTISGGHAITSGEYYYVTADLGNAASGAVSVSISDQTKLSFSTEAVCSAFSNALLSNPSDISLPVTVEGITAKVDAGQVHLNIATATEVDVTGFNISRSVSNDGPFHSFELQIQHGLESIGQHNGRRLYSFIDAKVAGGQTYYYKIESVSKSGVSQQVGEIIEVQVALPKEYALYQNYPNPFNPTTNIRFDLKADAKVTLEIYNVLGMKVRTFDNSTMSAGTHEIPVDMSTMPSGVYYYRFTAIDNTGKAFVQTQRMMLVK